MNKKYDLVVIGGGAAGLFCAGVAGQLGKKVLVIDHAEVLGEKIRISGGGRCNFTNVESSPSHFLSMNPHFVKSALSKYTPKDFIDLIKSYSISFHEKHRGQLFCTESAKQIVEMLHAECAKGGVDIKNPLKVLAVSKSADQWLVATELGEYLTKNVVMATGGLPVPAIGASDFSLNIAKQFELNVVPIRPALVPLSFTSGIFSSMDDLAGLSLPVKIAAGQKKQRYGRGTFDEDLLITHKGLSGPAVLQASSFWQEGEPLELEWIDEAQWQELIQAPESRVKVAEVLLAQVMPTKLAKEFVSQVNLTGRKWAEISNKDKQQLTDLICHWAVKPAGTLGWNKAEVMLGGVDTQALDGKTMMAKNHPGLFFIGECVDVTGHLGGHNFQWAWSSGFVCANSLLD
jgi:predicted Rossmann fold flavoprotein